MPAPQANSLNEPGAMAARLAAIVEFYSDAIIGKDLNGIVLSGNRGAEAIFGYTAAEMLGQSIRRLNPTPPP